MLAQSMVTGERNNMFLKGKISASLTVSAIALALGACASIETSSRDPYAAANYAGANRLYENDKVAAFRARPQKTESGEPLQAVAFEGIEGARLAHQRLSQADAEKVDGNCEQFVSVSTGESLIDVSRLCDVAVADLVDFNPAIENPYFVEPGKLIQLPFASDRAGTAFGIAGELADLYTIESGDTLSQIAYRYDVSTSAIANLNPYVTWSDVRAGDRLRLPATVSKPKRATRPVSNAGAKWEGYDGNTDEGVNNGAGLNSAVSALMPYNLGPIDTSAKVATYNPTPKLDVDKNVTKAGGAIKVTATGLPANSYVTFYRGDNVQSLKKYKTVRTDENGVASVSSKTNKKKSNAGGVVFKAEPANGKPIYSKRVGIVKLKEPK